jgi:hypothetical protein
MPTDTVTNDQTRLIDNVRTFDHELREHNQRIKTLKEQQKEIVESTDEYAVVESLKAQLKGAQDKLKYKLLGMPRYTDLAEKLVDEKHQKQEAEVEISDFLIAYHADTREQQIELEAGDAREVVLKAKLGKPKEFQLGMFTEAA